MQVLPIFGPTLVYYGRFGKGRLRELLRQKLSQFSAEGEPFPILS
jgi:hypothetical protein